MLFRSAGPKAVIKAIRVMQLHAFYLSLCYCYQPTEARVNSSFIHFFTLTLTQYLFVVDGHKPQYITHQEQKKLCDETPQLLKSFSCQVDLYESLPQAPLVITSDIMRQALGEYVLHGAQGTVSLGTVQTEEAIKDRKSTRLNSSHT